MAQNPDTTDETMLKANCPKCNAVVDAYDNACPECQYRFGNHEQYTLLKRFLFWLLIIGVLAGAVYILHPSLLQFL